MLMEPDDKKIAVVLSGNESIHTDVASGHCLDGALKEVEEEIKLIESMIERH